MLTGAGFGAVSIEDLTVRALIGRDTGEVIGHYRTTPVARSALANADERTIGQITQALRDALRPHQDDDGIRPGACAWVVTATRA